MSTEPTMATPIAIQAIGSSRSPSTSATTTGTAELRRAMSGVMSEIGPAASAAVNVRKPTAARRPATTPLTIAGVDHTPPTASTTMVSTTDATA